MAQIPFTGAADPVITEPTPVIKPGSVNGGASNLTAAQVLRSHLNNALHGKFWSALVEAIATGDEYLWDTAKKAFDQLFLSSASGAYLERQAANRGITKPSGLGVGDEAFRELVEQVTNNKLTMDAILRVLEVFYGPFSTRAYSRSIAEPFVISDGDELVLQVDEGETVTVTFRNDDFRRPSEATATEIAAVITKALKERGLAAYSTTETTNEGTYVVVFSGALGLRGSVRIIGGSAQNKLLFPERVQMEKLDGSSWAITRNTSTDRVRFTYVGEPANKPTLYRLRLGDTANIYGEAFFEANRGAKSIVGLGSNWFEVQSVGFAPQNVVIDGDDLLFYRPQKRTIYHNENYAVAAQPAAELLEVLLPATASIVERNAESAAYWSQSKVVPIKSAVRSNLGLVTVTTDGPHGIQTGDRIIIDGLYADQRNGGPWLENVNTMRHERIFHDAVTLPDGKVLVVGGTNDEEGDVTLAEYYDPEENEWTEVEMLDTNGGPVTRTGLKLTLLDNGYVLVTGSSMTFECHLYDYRNRVFLPTGKLNVMRSWHSATKLQSGKVLVWGGSNTDTRPEIYDPATGLFTFLPVNDIDVRTHHTATLLRDGRVLICGGQNADGDILPSLLFNPWTNTYVILSGGPQTQNHAAVLVPHVGTDGLVLIGGGIEDWKDDVPVVSNKLWWFEPTTQLFTHFGVFASKPESVGDSPAMALAGDGTVLIGCGADGSTHFNPVSGRIEKQDTIFNGAKMTTLHDGRILACGGYVDGVWSGDTFVFSLTQPLAAGGLNGIFTASYVTSNMFAYSTLEHQYESIVNDAKGATVTLFEAIDSPYGFYIYDPVDGASVTATTTVVKQELNAGMSHRYIEVEDASNFPDREGFLVFGFGEDHELRPVRYTNRPNSNTLTLDGSYVFERTIPEGSTVTLLVSKGPWEPQRPEQHGAFYATASTAGRVGASDMLDRVIAAGVNINKKVLYPGDRGLGGEGKPAEGQSPADKLWVWGGDDIDGEIAKARGE